VVYFLHGDHLGSTVLTTDGEGRRVGEVRYAPYGATRWAWGSPSTAYRYTGQRWEGGVGLYDYRARWYEPTLGRFVQPDSIVPEPGKLQALNRYTYVKNNPTGFVDPTGHYAALENGDHRFWPRDFEGLLSLSQGTEDLVRLYASTYGVPWQVVAGVLMSEVALDTEFTDSLENTFFRLFSSTPVADWALRYRPNPGPGIGNVHVWTAQEVSRYFAQHYSDAKEMQLNLHEMDTKAIAKRLTDDSMNIKVVAAYVRMLADYRFGSNRQPLTVDHADLSDWTLVDVAALWHGYRYGVPGVSPGAEGFAHLSDFQRRTYGVNTLMQKVAQGDAAAESLEEAIPFLAYYLYWRR